MNADPLPQPAGVHRLAPLTLAAVAAGALTAGAYLFQRRPEGIAFPGALVLAALIYLVAHGLRALRLFLLLNDGRLRLSSVLVAHLHASGVSALIPFKLGEFYRVGVLTSVCGDPLRAVVAVWIERIYDLLLMVLVFSGCAIAAGAWPGGLRTFLVVTGGFLLASSLIFLVLPENLSLLKRYLVLRHNRPWVPRVLAAIDQLHIMLRTAAAVGRYRRATIIWLGAAIWTLEVAVITITATSMDAESIAALLHGVAVEPRVWNAPVPAAAALRLATVDVLVAGALLLAPNLAVAAARIGGQQRKPQS